MRRVLHSFPARLACMILLVGFVLRAIVPTGYMLERGADGTVTVEICGSFGARLMAFDPVTGEMSELPEEAPGAPDDHAGCAFALNAVTTPPEPVLSVSPVSFARLMLGDRPVVAPELGQPVHAPLPARGPPLSV